MNFIQKNYSGVSLAGALLVGLSAFFISFRSSRNQLIEQVAHKMDAVTSVKQQLLERKLNSLEQQLNLLAKNDKLNSLLAASAKAKSASPAALFDEFAKSILYSQGYTSLWLIGQSGDVLYSSNPGMTSVPTEIQSFVQSGGQHPVALSKLEPFPFYFCKLITDSKGTFLGTLCLEVPSEFLSVELHNTISMDSLASYLVSAQGIMDQQGKINPDTCVTCKWGVSNFIQHAPRDKIKDTWTLVSVYPVSQIDVRHVTYLSILDGLIAFFVATGIVMVMIYCVQAFQKSKGITHADIMLVQTTWNAVSEYSIKIIAGFYKYLFADAPEVKPMFKSAQAEQEKRMALMINTIVNSADSLEEFKGSIAQLAKKHVHMGVKREYFPIVVKAIISSVEDQYGKGFSSAHRKAWYKILNQVSAIMIEEMDGYQRTLKTPGRTETGPQHH